MRFLKFRQLTITFGTPVHGKISGLTITNVLNSVSNSQRTAGFEAL